MITLSVPDGDKCEGCMFLRIGYMDNRADCALFPAERLHAAFEYGDIVAGSIEKCDGCPSNEGAS